MQESYILSLYRFRNTVFTPKDLALIWKDSNPKEIKRRIYRYVKAGKLYRIRRGFYAKDKNYDRLELATKIYTPSYISFETVLAKAGIVFQYYGQIFVASYLSREITADNQAYVYRKMKDPILTNNAGIEIKNNYSIASPERAFLDTLYLYKEYHFDNLSPLNWEKVFDILPIYQNKKMEERVQKYFKNIQKETK